MKIQTPYGVKEIKIIKSPHVINYQRRAGMIAAKWLAMSPYAKYQELLDQMNREYLAKLKQYQMEMEQKLKQMQFQSYNEVLKVRAESEQKLREIREIEAKRAAELLFNKLIEEGVPETEAREVVTGFLNTLPISNSEKIINSIYEEYLKKKIKELEAKQKQEKPQIQHTYSAPRITSTRKTYSHSGSSGKTGIVEIRDTSGRVVGYHDNVRKMSYMVPPSPPRTTYTQVKQTKVSEKPAEVKKVEKQLQQAVSKAEKEVKQTAEVIGKVVATNPIIQIAVAVDNFTKSVVNTIKSIFGWR